jgi:hypothetical protein
LHELPPRSNYLPFGGRKRKEEWEKIATCGRPVEVKSWLEAFATAEAGGLIGTLSFFGREEDTRVSVCLSISLLEEH